MQNRTSFRAFLTICLLGIHSCTLEDGELLGHGSNQALGEGPEPGDITMNEPETTPVSIDALRADFNGDGYADLAIGAPNKEIEGVEAGAVTILHGSANGLASAGSQVFHAGASAGVGTPDPDDEFGFALAAGHFDDDEFADLAIGAAGDDVNGANGAGSVTILRGSSKGLTAIGSQIWTQETADIADSAEEYDNFGYSLIAGDFDRDGFDDLAIGVLGEDIDNIADVGAVHVIRGSSTGLTAVGSQFLLQGASGLGETAENGDRFGTVLTAGKFNDDDFVDLAIGVPGENLGQFPDAGLVHVIHGSSAGLFLASSVVGSPPAPQIWHQDVPGINDACEALDEFGWALAAGDFDGDGHDDLSIGVPGEDVGNDSGAGAMHVIYGTKFGLGAVGDQYWTQDSLGVEGETDPGDYFGESLAAGDFDGSGHDDVAVGSFGENLGVITDAGVVTVLYGTDGGLSESGDQRWQQNKIGVEGIAESFDCFAASLSSGDYDGDGTADLAIGVPYENVGVKVDAGQVNVMYGMHDDGLTTVGDQIWHQDSTGVPEAADANDNFGAAVH